MKARLPWRPRRLTQAEIAGMMTMVETGKAVGMSVSGVDLAELDRDLRAEAARRGLRLDVQMLPGGSWTLRVAHQPAPISIRPEPAAAEPVDVLLVDDDDVFAGFAARYLEAHGITARIAGSEEEAEQDLASAPAKLVLLDINLPGEAGWSLLDTAAYTGAGSPPVVIVSATAIYPKRLRAAGVRGYLPKPFAMETLLATVQRTLGREPAPAAS